MKRYLKALCIVLSSTMLLSTTAFATETTNVANNQSDSFSYEVLCPQYPDTYIIVDNNINNRFASSNYSNSLSVSATVFVEENEGYENGEVVTYSRLLSKDEVDAIGPENFVDANIPQLLKAKLFLAQNSLYKLTIRADGRYTTSGNSVTANISGGAKWSGEFTSSQSYAEAFYDDSTPMQSNPAPITLCDGVPNAARVWMLDEYKKILLVIVIYLMRELVLFYQETPKQATETPQK